jgi:hypothetical protein
MKYTLSALILTLLLAGCSDDGNKGDPTLRTGQLFFSGIEGLTYQTATLSGAVNEDGSFTYREGETATFWLGDVLIAEGVPAKEYITSLEFSIDGRSRLEAGDVINGFSTHTVAEDEVSEYQYENNVTRFIQLMDDNVSEANVVGREIEISSRSIEQMNNGLLALTIPLDFKDSIENFEKYTKPAEFVPGECPTDAAPTPDDPLNRDPNEHSPTNVLLGDICFFSAESFLCAAPPSQTEIDCAPSKFKEDGTLIDDYDEDLKDFYKEDLLEKRTTIINSFKSTELKSSDKTKSFMQTESSLIYQALGARLFFNQYVETAKEGDNAERTISIYSEDKNFTISGMEVESENDRIVRVDRFSEEDKTFTYSPIGVSGEEATIIINLRVNNDYRWYRKNYRVIIE